MSSLKKNVIYNVLYQILILIVPLVTIPYVSRVLGADGVGIYSYTYSIVYYFMIISLLGINNYGNRTIAKTRDDVETMSIKFCNIYCIQFLMSLMMIIVYVSYLIYFDIQYKTIAYIQILFIFSSMFDINWFFFGLEEFKVTITRSSILKILTLVFVFIMVKDHNDLWKYTLIMSASTLISQLLLWPFLLKRIKFKRSINIKELKKHLKPCIILFIPVIAVSLYKIMDKVMLGYLVNVTELGFYEQAEKIISVPGAIITALGTVMLPRISNLISKKDEKQALIYIEKSTNIMMFLAFPMMFGIIAISKDFIPIFLGKGFTKSIILLDLLSITIIFSSFANVIRTEYLLPNEKDKIYIISVIGGAIINLIANLLLIPKYMGIGACIGTILAEFFVFFIQAYFVRKDIPVIHYIKSVNLFLVKSIIMFIIIYVVGLIDFNIYFRILFQVIIGCCIYALLNIKYILKIIDFNKIKRKIIKS